MTQVKFLLDSVSFPEIINLTQTIGQEILDVVMYLTRTWAFAVHRQKLKLLGRWPEGVKSKNTPANFCFNTNQQPIPVINDISAMVPYYILTNIFPITGSTTYPTTTSTTPQDDDVSQAAPVAETHCHHQDKPPVPGPSPSAHIDMLEQGQLGGQVVRGTFKSFLQSYLQSSPNYFNKQMPGYQCTAPL